MLYLTISIIILGIVAAVIGKLQRQSDAQPTEKASCASCDGQSGKCEQECMMEASVRDIEYYDDEELDKYIGRTSDSYTDKETEEFSEVLYTMRPEEVKGWNRSLILRRINLPDQLKDEVVMIIKDN